MAQQRPQDFWTNMLVHRPVTDTLSSRNPTAARPRRPDSLLDGEKAGVTLLVSGMLLALVGATFTTTGWKHYLHNPSFQWTRLLGPILISVGGTFILTSAFKFGIILCRPCRQWDEEVIVIPVVEQTSTGHYFTLSGINVPVILHRATAGGCTPPTYDFMAQEVRHERWPGGPVNGAHPPLDTVHCVDNTAFASEGEDNSAHGTETDHRHSRCQKTEGGRGGDDESSSTCSRPPAYEDICPP